MRLTDKISSYNLNNSWTELRKMIHKGTTEINSSGVEKLSVPGYEGSIKVSHIATLINEYCRIPEADIAYLRKIHYISIKQRKEGLKITQRLKVLHAQAWENASSKIKLLYGVQRIAPWIKSAAIDEDTEVFVLKHMNKKLSEKTFRTFTAKQFILHFGISKEGSFFCDPIFALICHPNLEQETSAGFLAKNLDYHPSLPIRTIKCSPNASHQKVYFF